MLTPLDIQNKEFKKSIRGYKEIEVDSFLDEIIIDYEKLYKENIELKDKIGILNDRIKQYSDLEQTLKDTLIVAQSTAEEINTTAKQKAELIVQKAESDSRDVIHEARRKVLNIEEEYDQLKKEIYVFKTKFKSLIQAQLSTLEDYYEEVDKEKKEKADEDDTYQNENEIDELKQVDKVDDMGA